MKYANNNRVVDRNHAMVLSYREKPSQQAEKPVIKTPVAPKPPVTPKPPGTPNPSGTPEWPVTPTPPVATPEGEPCLECGDLSPGAKPSDDDERAEDEDRAIQPPDRPVFLPRPDGKPLKYITSNQGSYEFIDEAVNAEGFAIVETHYYKN
ncbi:MAG: hypothetical protein ACMZI0_15780 [Symbiopectobacterium sp.]|uniref:hypothetical protein n=1 Tax=Symbiopectobacterium sp. TaxID=2952789 RepID=UPI0039EBDFE2